MDVTSLDGNNGFAIVGSTKERIFGADVKGLRDINGDGLEDFAVTTDSVWVTVFFGRKTGVSSPFPAEFSEGSVNSSFGFRLVSSTPGRSLTQVFALGDVNKDGRPDFMISSYSSSRSGAFVIFGRNSSQPFPSTVVLGSFADGARGFYVVCFAGVLVVGMVGNPEEQSEISTVIVLTISL